ncbi:CidA/LrgA family protein [Muribacter muris]|uniref:CidA/LrgA family protein n=1 Tax=Muribacter muris TaxID=67855 RepID=UPI003898F477
MTLGFIKLNWVLPASRPLLRYMTLFFLPICAGIVEQTEVLLAHLNALVMANFFSAVLSLIVIGYFSQWLFSLSVKRERRR